MTKKEQLEFCKKCSNRKFDSKQGLLCNLTGKFADFEETCENFELDESLEEKAIETSEIQSDEMLTNLDESTINKLKTYQDFNYAIVGGLLATLISAIIWAIITVSTEYQIGFMAIGVGILVGFTIQYFGAGVDMKFGYLGAFLSLLGCLLGNLFSQVGFIAQEQYLGYFETLSYFDFEVVKNILIDTFNPMDLLFYGIAIYEGYKFAFRRITANDVERIQEGSYDGKPPFYKTRMPLVIASIAVILFFFFKISQGVNGVKTFKYESGMIMSEGEMTKSKEQGKWTYWDENGNVQLIGYYKNGIQDGLWQWFNASGKNIKTGNYKKGLEHGSWISYYENGSKKDSVNYIEGRMNGKWKYWFENGNVNQIGHFKRNAPDGNWKTYFENGQLISEGEMVAGNQSGIWTNYYTNGQIANRTKYTDNNHVSIEDAWDIKGNQIVINGNGTYKLFSNENKLLQKGSVENGLRIGKWVNYFENGEKCEEGIYEQDIYKLSNVWDSQGEQLVKDGFGEYISYYTDDELIYEIGEIENGLREGPWKVYFESSDIINQEQNYLNGKLNGLQKIYYESGELYAAGEMKDGIQEGEWNWYYKNGLASSKVSFVDNEKEGKQTMWSEIGDKTKEEYYKNGELIEEKLF